MADTIWVYAEISEDKITTTSLEMLAKASEAGKAVTDEGEGGKQIADFLAEIKVI